MLKGKVGRKYVRYCVIAFPQYFWLLHFCHRRRQKEAAATTAAAAA
jgi:hypothetical protein